MLSQPHASAGTARRWVLFFLVPLLLLQGVGLTPLVRAEEAPSAAGPSPTMAPTAVSSTSGPAISFKELEWDFGEVYQGDEAIHVFSFTNTGTETLKVLNVKSTCGCTAAILTDRELEPGESGEIKVEYDTTRGRGRVSKYVTVTSNDAANPELRLRISLDVKVEVDIVPAKAVFGNIFVDELNKREIKVSAPSLSDFRVTKVEVDSPHVTSDLKDAADGSTAKTLTLTIGKDAPLGRFSATARVHTTSKKQPVVEIPITAQIGGDIEVKPVRLYLTPFTQGETREGKVTIRDRKGSKDFAIVNVVDKNGYLNIKTEVVKEGVEYAVIATTKAEMPGGLQSGHFAGVLEITTNRPGEETITVAYNGFIKMPETK